MEATVYVPQQVKDDLRFALGFFPTEALLHVRANRHRLIRGAYRRAGRGCLFSLLSEVLPADQQITTREDLTRFFTGSTGENVRELPQYQPARWLVRLVDGQDCLGRYDEYRVLDWDDLMDMLDELIAERRQVETESRRIERRALKILRKARMSSN
jgi:hypothetical protein